jgi:hypothetical protein
MPVKPMERTVMNDPRNIIRLAVVVGGMIMFAGFAQAFSDEAVQDAEALLKTTEAQTGSGHLDNADVALARYYLLEMKYKAGNISPNSFCQAAQPNLQIVAKAFEGPDGHVGEKKEWQNEIATMNSSQSTCEKATNSAGILLFGETKNSSPEETLKSAQDFAAKTNDDFVTGEATKLDVAQAQHELLDARYHAGQLSRGTYCQSGTTELQDIASGIEEEQAAGQITLQDEIAAKRYVFRSKAVCSESPHVE